MTKRLCILLTIICVNSIFSQEIEFGEVSKEELREINYPMDSSANAAFLYKNQKTYLSSSTSVQLITEIHERIKIYNNEGFDKATRVINLYKNRSTKERVSKIKAHTYNLVDGKIEKTELEKDQIFDNEYSYNYNQVKFTMPNVKEGSVLEISYKISSPFYFNIDEFKFQYDIPIKKLDAEIRTPEGYNFSPKQKGYLNIFPKHSSKRDNRLGMIVNILNYSLEDIPALKEESYVNNIDNYRSGVFFELVSIEIPGTGNRYYAKNWGDVAKTIGSTDDYKKELDKTNSFDDSLDELISNSKSDSEKMESIFKYVKNNIKWNEMDGKYFYHGIRKALKEKEGNAADVNLTLVAMLRYAGIDANPLIISTKDNMVPFYPTVDRLNYVIAFAVINGENYFLDATEEFSDINILPLKDYNWKGILVDNNKLVWKNIEIDQPDPGITLHTVEAKLDDEGTVSGKVKSRYQNHSAYLFRKGFKDNALDVFLQQKEDDLENIEISNYNSENTDQSEGYVNESFDFYKEDTADLIDDKIYLQPLLFLKLSENPFKLDQRIYPIDLGYPVNDRYMIGLTLPEGYKVEAMPEPAIIKMPNDLGVFKFSPNVFGNKVQLSVAFELNKSFLSADTYLILKEFFNQIIQKQTEQVILTKA